jgi:hypothetical protein
MRTKSNPVQKKCILAIAIFGKVILLITLQVIANQIH